jgi:hypothetical protein
LRLECAEHIGETSDGQRGRRLDAQVIDQIVAFLAHARQKIADIRHHAARPVDILLTGLGQPQLTGRSMEQRGADPSFELGDAFGHHGSRDVELAGGRRKAGGVGGGQKSLQVDEDIHPLFTIRGR